MGKLTISMAIFNSYVKLPECTLRVWITRTVPEYPEAMDFEVAREIETEGDMFEEEHWDFNSQKGHETNCLMER